MNFNHSTNYWNQGWGPTGIKCDGNFIQYETLIDFLGIKSEINWLKVGLTDTSKVQKMRRGSWLFGAVHNANSPINSTDSIMGLP